MEIRPARREDLDAIMAVYETARAFMRENGNTAQWINGYPSRTLLADDIAAGTCYVEEDGDGIHGVFVCIPGEDPTYGTLEGGQWLNRRPYAAIHRVGSDGKHPGFLSRCVEVCKTVCPDLRVDTHADNRVMRKLLDRLGFQRCGRIYLEDGSPREAYQWAADARREGERRGSRAAEIIAVGTELLLGSVANTNAQEISQALSSVGVNVFWHTVVGDNPARLKAALDIARSRADILITTGGLGPTYDDMTKQTVCETFGKPLVFHPDILETIRYYFERNTHISMPENNRQQAELPEGCAVFDNPVGTAPGCAFEAEGIHVLMLPGPPFEMRTMLENHVLPYLRQLSDEVIVSHDIMTFGLGESPMEELLREKMARMTNPSLATYAKPSEVRLRATAKAKSRKEAEIMLAPVVEEVTALLGDVVYGVDVDSMEQVCVKLLKERGWTMATAESCTGGRVAARLTGLAGVSSAYRGGVVSYWTSVKGAVLGVPQEILDTYGAVSEPCARAMAEGACRVTGAEVAVSVTGVAGPDPDERGNPVGLVYIGLATPTGTFCRALDLGPRRRDRIQDLSSNHAFDVVRRYLTGLPVETIQSSHP